MRFEWRSADTLSDVELEAWRVLSRSACTGNFYLAPEFLLPALRHLPVPAGTRLAILWDGPDMAAVGLFTLENRSLRFPFPRLTAVRTRHSFQSGLLLRAGLPDVALDAYLDGLLGCGARAVRFAGLRADSRTYRALRAAVRRRGMRWFADDALLRPAVLLTRPEAWRRHLPRDRSRLMAAQRRRLQRLGDVDFRLVTPDAIDASTVNEFLRLESAFRDAAGDDHAAPLDQGFFREVCRLGRGNVFFCELLLDGHRIASTAHFYVGARGFAFRSGADPAYAIYQPELLVEYEALRRLDAWPASLLEIESGAVLGNRLGDYWPERIPLVGGHAVGGAAPLLFARLKYAWKRRRVPAIHPDLRPDPAAVAEQAGPGAHQADPPRDPAPAAGGAEIIYLSEVRRRA